MDVNSWVGAISGLLGALIGGSAVLLSQQLEARRRANAAADTERKLAVEEVLVRSQAVDLRSHQAMALAANLGSVSGLVGRALGSLAPVDLQGLFDGMTKEAEELERAASRVWLFGDERTIALTNAVVVAAMDVVEAHHSPVASRVAAMTRVALIGQFASDKARVASLRESLASARRDLVQHVRADIGLPYVDPFAMPPDVQASASDRRSKRVPAST